jgi:hypothetical protein
MSKKRKPISIDMWSRNERLLPTLLEMGLVVIPIYTPDESKGIDHFIVSSGIPTKIKYQEQRQG